jgi:hypothetical protein
VALWISASGSAGLLMPLPFVTPNQMSEHARRRDLIQLRPFLSPCRGLGRAGEAPTHNQNYSGNPYVLIYLETKHLTGNCLVAAWVFESHNPHSLAGP